jgi:hypothetical protein
MTFSNATRTHVICDQNDKEIGWIYTTDEGDQLVHYFNGKPKNFEFTSSIWPKAQLGAS